MGMSRKTRRKDMLAKTLALGSALCLLLVKDGFASLPRSSPVSFFP